MEYGCIGEHLCHSFSKEIHNALADYDYKLKELSKEELPTFMKEKNFKAINVTIPYKQDVIPFLDSISDIAKRIGAVNTIVNKDGKLYGYNTDFSGLRALIERMNVSSENKKVAILGSGGTSNTAFAVSECLGASSVLKISRTPKDGYITYNELYEKHSNVQILINTTPCGMFPNTGVAAVELERLPNVEAVFDAVYNPLSSKLILDAKSRGIPCSGGLYMLVSQAAYAVERFVGTPVDSDAVEKIFNDLYKSKMNIVLIGMPSSGKTTVGKYLSEKLSKSFVDTDDLIVQRENKSISDIFKEQGEAQFRNIEKDVIYNISKYNAKVIATGGGAVLDKENIENLKGNGRVYFINRPLEQLITTDDRPLSSNREALEQRYKERYSLYMHSADVVIDGSGTVEEIAKRIEADYYGYSCD